MQFQYSHRRDEKEAIFFSVENGQTTSIAKGSLCAWDVANNVATPGILANTRGVRVIIYPVAEAGIAIDGLKRQAGFAHTAMEGTPANTRGTQSYLIQVYGFRDDVLADTSAGGNIIPGGGLVPSADAVGKVDGYLAEATPTVNELNKTVGMAYDITAAATVVTIQALVNCLR